MFTLFKKKQAATAHINGAPLTVLPRETLLQAALRSGVDFPHSCRVGGCATCKCRLVSGRVRELTQSGYVLSAAELEQGYILACQSVPATDIAVEVDLAARPASRRVTGRVLAQQRLTHDITLLQIQLDEGLTYKAGQFAQLGLAALGQHARSYSFATPMQADAQVQFFVRKVEGGALSTLVNERDLTGVAAIVEGPSGDCWLRSGAGPLVMVAGGSGLAPILAMLLDAAQTTNTRPVTLLFGARTESDLYALNEIEAIRQRWRAPFTFIPVLSALSGDDAWHGARGMVGDHLPVHIGEAAQAYLCGPPAMVDACTAALLARGVAHEHIFADRFITIRRP